MRVRRFALTATLLTLCLVTGTACSGGGSASEGASPADPPGFKRFGGPANGVSVAVPETWTTLDLSKDDPKSALAGVGLSSQTLEQVGRNLRPLVSAKAIWAAETEALKNAPFATNLNGFCQPSSGFTADTLIAKAREQFDRINAEVSEAAETRVGAVRAVRLVYTVTTGGRRINGTQYHVPFGRRTCVVTLSTDRDDMRELFDWIGQTIAPPRPA